MKSRAIKICNKVKNEDVMMNAVNKEDTNSITSEDSCNDNSVVSLQ